MDDSAPTSSIPSAATAPRSWLRRPSELHILIVSVALALVVGVLSVLTNYSFIRFAVETHGARFSVVEKGESAPYEVFFGSIKKRATAAGFEQVDISILEAVPYDQLSGNVAVLARVPATEGTVLGILHKDGSFSSILADGTVKSDLAVRPDGFALFSATVQGESHIMQMNIASPEASLTDLGKGKSPRLYADGFFVAFTPVGLVRVDPAVSDHSILLARTDADLMPSSLSADGTRAIMPNTSGKTDFITLQSLSPAQLSVDSVVSAVYGAPAVWVSKNYFVVPKADGRFVLYRMNGQVPHIVVPTFSLK